MFTDHTEATLKLHNFLLVNVANMSDHKRNISGEQFQPHAQILIKMTVFHLRAMVNVTAL